MAETVYPLLQIAVMAAVTAGIRFLPFLLFQKRTPGMLLELGEALPYAIIGMLVVYCLKDINLPVGNHGIPELLAVALVVVLHKWKHNTLLSILLGTLFYMALLQLL